MSNYNLAALGSPTSLAEERAEEIAACVALNAKESLEYMASFNMDSSWVLLSVHQSKPVKFEEVGRGQRARFRPDASACGAWIAIGLI